MPKTYITSKKLIETLKISSQGLIDIEQAFDADPNDEWDLQQGKDYRVVVKATGLREYTETGAYSIAKYLEKHQQLSFWDKLKEWFLHTKKNIRQAFIREKILDNCSSLVKRNDRFFISSADVVYIFGTRSDYLRKMAQEAQRQDSPPIKGQDYDDFGDGIYYSLSGIEKLAKAFKDNLSQKNRRDFCEDVGEIIQDQVGNKIVAQILNREKDVSKAMKKAKDRDKKCRVSYQSGDKINKLKLAAHHLYSQAEYPHLAANEANLITLSESVHEEFHIHFMGGAQKISTIDHFIQFVQERYPENTNVVVWLKQQKLTLGTPQPLDARKPHVLYLPAKRVS